MGQTNAAGARNAALAPAASAIYQRLEESRLRHVKLLLNTRESAWTAALCAAAKLESDGRIADRLAGPSATSTR